MKIAQGDPERSEGAALGTRSIMCLAPRRGAATFMSSPKQIHAITLKM